MLDQAERLRQMVDGVNDTKKRARIMTITSGKGGVGKSNIVVNLAIQIRKMGYKVLVFDADIGMGNDDVLMGIFPKNNIFNLISDDMDIKDVICDGPEGIKLLSGGSGLNKVEDMGEAERRMFLDKLESLDDFDYILMDTGAGINRSVLAFISSCDELILVITPEPTSITDGYSLIKAVDHFKVKDRCSIIINRTLDEDEGINTFRKFDSVVKRFLNIKVSYLGEISEDKKLVQSVRAQTPFLINHPNCTASRCIMNIADNLIGIEKEKVSVGAKGLFKKLFNIFS